MSETKDSLSVDCDQGEKIAIYLSYETKWAGLGREAKILACLSSPKIEWPIFIGMPCGETLTIKDISDFPKEKLMCPCGNENHILVDFNF